MQYKGWRMMIVKLSVDSLEQRGRLEVEIQLYGNNVYNLNEYRRTSLEVRNIYIVYAQILNQWNLKIDERKACAGTVRNPKTHFQYDVSYWEQRKFLRFTKNHFFLVKYRILVLSISGVFVTFICHQLAQLISQQAPFKLGLFSERIFSFSVLNYSKTINTRGTKYGPQRCTSPALYLRLPFRYVPGDARKAHVGTVRNPKTHFQYDMS